MFSKLLLATAAAAVAVTVNAQANSSSSAPSATPSLSACILACVVPAATNDGCSSFTNITCICASKQFQVDAAACIEENCSAGDLEAAMALQAAECGAAGISATGIATPQSVAFTLASSASASGANTTAGTAATLTPTTPAVNSTVSATLITSATSATAAGTTVVTGTTTAAGSTASPSKAAAEPLVANGAGALIGALLASVLAL